MRISASGLVRAVKLGLAPCFVLGLLIGCGSDSGPGVSEPANDGAVAAAKAPTLTPAEKRRAKGAVKAASGVQPSGAK
jgi:hypothetical protein